MTVAGPRNPSRTREFYDSRMLPVDSLATTAEPVLNATTPTVASSAAPPPTAVAVADLVPSTPVPAARPQLKVAPEKKPEASSSTTTPAPPLIGMLNNMWDGVRGMLGISKPTCLNGGKAAPAGNCKCPKYFEGPSCERKMCLNGGSLTKVTAGQVTFECLCPHPLYIEGLHCETIRCANQALLVREANNSWSCDCSQRMFYKGIFCEKFSPPIGIAVPVIVALIFLLCCGLCRIDWCPRNQNNRRRDGRSGDRNRSEQQRRRQQPPRNNGRPRTSGQQRQNPAQEFLLPGDRTLCSRNPVAFPAHGNPYIIRLDTIPTFNPNMIGGVEPIAAAAPVTKPIDPPPSYEQAIQAPPAPEPPRYTEHPDQTQPTAVFVQPPPPNRQPPAPPPS